MQSRSYNEAYLKNIKEYAKRKQKVAPIHFNITIEMRQRVIQRAKELDLSVTAYLRKLVKKDLNEKILKEY